jgi:hypothetical protein
MAHGQPAEVHIRLGLSNELILGQDTIFVQTQVLGVGSNEAAGEHAAWHLGELLCLQGFQEPPADLGGSRDLLQRHTAHLSFAPEVLAKGGHRSALIHRLIGAWNHNISTSQRVSNDFKGVSPLANSCLRSLRSLGRWNAGSQKGVEMRQPMV